MCEITQEGREIFEIAVGKSWHTFSKLGWRNWDARMTRSSHHWLFPSFCFSCINLPNTWPAIPKPKNTALNVRFLQVTAGIVSWIRWRLWRCFRPSPSRAEACRLSRFLATWMKMNVCQLFMISRNLKLSSLIFGIRRDFRV